MKKKGWSDDMEERAVNLYRETSMHAGLIAQQLGVSPWMVKQALKRRGVAMSRGRRAGSHCQRQLSPEQKTWLAQQYAAGTATEPLAGQLGISSSTVQRYLRELGVPLRPSGFRDGEEHHAWRGGRIVTDDGYVLVLVPSDDPFYGMAQVKTANKKYCLEHRYVMAQKLGRLLLDQETVHHKDGNKQNNHPDNLQLRQGNHGKGACLRCATCGSYDVVADELGES